MKIETEKLTGVQLAYATAKAVYEDGREVVIAWGICQLQNAPDTEVYSRFDLNWWWLGPLIIRFKIDLQHLEGSREVRATMRGTGDICSMSAPEGQELEAIARCVVRSRLGLYVEIPEDVEHEQHGPDERLRA